MSKRIIIITLLIILVIGMIVGVYQYIQWKNKETQETMSEYTPEQEISEEQMRQTIVSLYFKSDKTLMPEARLVDVKVLIENPYEEILKLLIEGPKNEKLERIIPEGTKINKLTKEGENLVIDFSKEFLENQKNGEEGKKLAIKSIVNTMTELTEINGIKIKIDGQEKEELKEVFHREM